MRISTNSDYRTKPEHRPTGIDPTGRTEANSAFLIEILTLPDMRQRNRPFIQTRYVQPLADSDRG